MSLQNDPSIVRMYICFDGRFALAAVAESVCECGAAGHVSSCVCVCVLYVLSCSTQSFCLHDEQRRRGGHGNKKNHFTTYVLSRHKLSYTANHPRPTSHVRTCRVHPPTFVRRVPTQATRATQTHIHTRERERRKVEEENGVSARPRQHY